jgi:hypothetical protein
MVRLPLLAVSFATALFAAPPAKAEGYRWCIELGGGMGGSSNCGFETLEQCKESLLGQSGFCRPNPFYRPLQETTSGKPGRRAGENPRRN